ncbi:hypothetical protein BI347_08070 [Chromobacterium sphagni]|uniref:histidine kinase n=1 Tax=Chromobacterium sphagni TaxID=1903179 RepID=A0A1S1X1Q5_9NEIS|nr:HAMP domain-containing sensor histidine kinase [Chromobacterium sphagni]OHX13473.1 hypothetical protein BI347_08070 [Chromobacterium sphagni]
MADGESSVIKKPAWLSGRLSPVFWLVFLLVSISAYIAIDRYAAVKKFEGRSEDLYWSVAQLQIALERSRAELVRLKAGEVRPEQADVWLEIAKSRFMDYVTPSPLHGMLNSVEGFQETSAVLKTFFRDENLGHLSRQTAQTHINQIDDIRPRLAEFAVQSRVSEVSFRDARNKDLERKRLVFSLWFALWGGIGIIIWVLLSRYRSARRDVASRQALLEKERAAHKATVSAELDRTTFLATISHEIRSPLQTMQACLELIELEVAPGNRIHANLMRLKASMTHLLTQVRDIMDLSAINNMKFRLHPEDIDIAMILNEVVDAYRVQLDGKGLKLELSMAGLPETAKMDGNRLRQIVGNLLANAIRYTDHGHVSVSARVNGIRGFNSLEIKVGDTGIGIPADYQSRIFQPFFQGKQRKPGSSGLGLAIVKELVCLLGGEIELKSEEGCGTEFIVRLPVHIQQQEGGNERSVLLVDDDENIREPFADCLSIDGYAVVMAGSVTEACQRLQQQSFDAILLDMQLGEGSGYNVLEFVKKSRNNKHASIIAMTAYPEEYADPRSACFAERLEKPFDFNRLRSVLKQHVS